MSSCGGRDIQWDFSCAETCRKGMGRKLQRFGGGLEAWRQEPMLQSWEQDSHRWCLLRCPVLIFCCSRSRVVGWVFWICQRNELLGTWHSGDLGSTENVILTVSVIALRKVRSVKILNLYRKTRHFVMAPAFHALLTFSLCFLFVWGFFMLACGFDAKLMKNWTVCHF